MELFKIAFVITRAVLRLHVNFSDNKPKFIFIFYSLVSNLELLKHLKPNSNQNVHDDVKCTEKLTRLKSDEYVKWLFHIPLV